jgi:polyisoprenoid-binding protein YceI
MRFFAPAVAAAALLTATPALAAPTTWEIDSAHSAATFSIKHMMVSTVRGEFGKLTGTVTMEGNDWKTAKVEASVDTSTINTREPKRDAHLKSSDFFDVAKFPTLSFKSTKVESSGGGGYKLTGDITIRGVTKPIVFEVQQPSKEWKGLMGKMVVGASGTAKLNRKDFGLTWNRPLEAAGGMLVGDEVTIQVDLELVKK